MRKDENFRPEKVQATIGTPLEFSAWRKEIRAFGPLDESKKYRFQFALLPESENRKISDQVNRYTRECGCSSGSILMNLAFLITVAGYFSSGGKFSSIGCHHLLWLAGITFAAAITGKAAGLLLARWKLIRLSDTIHQTLSIDLNGDSIVTNHTNQ